ncbi:MAG: hypothetical protein ACOZNI_13170 [Myxococcota bacterium]
MILLALLSACERRTLPACDGPRTEGWAPLVSEETRLDAHTAVWEGTGIGQCVGCLALTGPAVATAPFVADRGIPWRLVGTLASTEGARVIVRHVSGTGSLVEVARAVVAAGEQHVELEFTFSQPGESAEVVLEVDAGEARFDRWGLLAETWLEVEADPTVPLLLGFLIHVERDASFEESPNRWWYRQQVIEGLADVFARHDAVLTVQPDFTFVRAGERLVPGWVGDLAAAGVAFSVHLHAEEEGSAQSVGNAAQQARAAFAAAGLPEVRDMNGGFATGAWGLASREGIVSVSAFKDPDTQLGLPLAYVQPWRPEDRTGTADLDAFVEHDPDGPVVYLPGSPTREVDHPRITEFVRRQLSQALAHVREGHVNTWYFVLHVDNFVPEEEDDRDAYFADGRFEVDLAEYDRMLTEGVDPWVAARRVEPASPDTMTARVLAWEEACSD